MTLYGTTKEQERKRERERPEKQVTGAIVSEFVIIPHVGHVACGMWHVACGMYLPVVPLADLFGYKQHVFRCLRNVGGAHAHFYSLLGRSSCYYL